MKIVYFSSSTLPSQAANSVHVVNMAEALAELGHEVRLIHETGETVSADEVFAFYGLTGGFLLCPVSCPRLRYVGLLLYSLVGFFRYVIGSGASLIYSRNYLGALFCALARYRTVLELHSMPESWLRKLTFGVLSRCSKLAAVVTISGALRDDVLERYPYLKARVLVAHDAATEYTDVVPQVFGQAGAIKIGYVGGLYQGKGVEMAVEIARRLPSVSVHVVGGEGQLLADWRIRAADAPNLVFHGFRPPAEIPSYIAAFDIVLLPNQWIVHTHGGTSDIGRWTSPLKMFEYMAAGKPIICSDLPVLREVMVSEHNCLLCTPDDPAQWVKALGRLKENPRLREQLGEQGRADFRNNYTWRKRAERLLEAMGGDA